ncbi:MAG: hypothetical protein ACLFPL_02915 [Candidatus Nanoarchaeia archaeon]
MVIVVTTDSLNSIDTLCSMLAYTHFLTQQQEQAICIIPNALTELQQEVITMCKAELPTLQLEDIKEDNCNFILVNISSLDSIHPRIEPNNITGIIANFVPQYFEHIEQDEFGKIHIEEEHSLSTLIVEKFKLTNTPIEHTFASLLLVGIILNSNGLEERQTTNRDFVAIEYIEQFANIRKDQINALVNQL